MQCFSPQIPPERSALVNFSEHMLVQLVEKEESGRLIKSRSQIIVALQEVCSLQEDPQASLGGASQSNDLSEERTFLNRMIKPQLVSVLEEFSWPWRCKPSSLSDYPLQFFKRGTTLSNSNHVGFWAERGERPSPVLSQPFPQTAALQKNIQ